MNESELRKQIERMIKDLQDRLRRVENLVILGYDESYGKRSERIGQAEAIREIEMDLRSLIRVEKDTEICICAAIRLQDGRIFRGHRHDVCFEAAYRVLRDALANNNLIRTSEQGFITSKNRYVGREEALQLQLAAGIQSHRPHGYNAHILTSEDLY